MKKYSRATWMFLVPAMAGIAVAAIGALKGDGKPVYLSLGMVFLILAVMTEAKARKDQSGPD